MKCGLIFLHKLEAPYVSEFHTQRFKGGERERERERRERERKRERERESESEKER